MRSRNCGKLGEHPGCTGGWRHAAADSENAPVVRVCDWCDCSGAACGGMVRGGIARRLFRFDVRHVGLRCDCIVVVDFGGCGRVRHRLRCGNCCFNRQDVRRVAWCAVGSLIVAAPVRLCVCVRLVRVRGRFCGRWSAGCFSCGCCSRRRVVPTRLRDRRPNVVFARCCLCFYAVGVWLLFGFGGLFPCGVNGTADDVECELPHWRRGFVLKGMVRLSWGCVGGSVAGGLLCGKAPVWCRAS